MKRYYSVRFPDGSMRYVYAYTKSGAARKVKAPKGSTTHAADPNEVLAKINPIHHEEGVLPISGKPKRPSAKKVTDLGGGKYLFEWPTYGQRFYVHLSKTEIWTEGAPIDWRYKLSSAEGKSAYKQVFG